MAVKFVCDFCKKEKEFEPVYNLYFHVESSLYARFGAYDICETCLKNLKELKESEQE